MLGDESDTTVTDDTDDEETIEVEESYETKVRGFTCYSLFTN